MIQNLSVRRGDAVPCVLAVAGCLLFMLGANLWLIAAYGSSTPYWDHWAELVGVYHPYTIGTLGIDNLIAPHSEHRILMTRLTGLGVFMLNGGWDPVLQAIINTLPRAAWVGCLVVMLMRPLSLAGRLMLAVSASLLFTVPLSWQNVIYPFNNQYYFLLLFGASSLWLLCGSTAWTARWWIGTLLGVLSYFTVALGALTLAAYAALVVVQIAAGRRTQRNEVLGLLLHLLLTAVMVIDIPMIPETVALRAKSLPELLDSITLLASWPIAKTSWPMPARLLTALVIYAPGIVLTVRMLRKRPAPEDPRWMIVMILAWGALLLLAAAYSRGIAALNSRYYDMLLVGLAANAAALFLLVLAEMSARRQRLYVAAASIWLLATGIGFGYKVFDYVVPELAERRSLEDIQTRNLSEFLRTGDFSTLADKPPFHIPFPSAEALRDFISDPATRPILPARLSGIAARYRFAPPILDNGPRILIPIGLALFLVAVLVAGAGMRTREDEQAAGESDGAAS